MKNALVLFSTVAVIGMSVSAYAAEESVKTESEIKQDGGYESSTSTKETTPTGTEKSTETSTDIDVDRKGFVTETVKTKDTEDPAGLVNKKVHTTKTKVKEKEYGGYEKSTTSKSTDPKGANVSTESKQDVDIDAAGNVKTTTETEKTVDPKGWMNKRTTSSETTTVNGKTVEQKKESDY